MPLAESQEDNISGSCFEGYLHADGSYLPMESSVTRQGLTVGMVGAVELSTQERLRQHVLRGHKPYDPHCLECQQGRGVSRAPRRSLKERLLEVQVDFMFLGTVGSQYKFLLFHRCFSEVVYWVSPL